VTPVTRTIAFTLLTLVLGTAALAQAPTTAPAPSPTAATTPAAPVAAPAAAGAQTKNDAVEPQGYTYNPEGRRDPFVSLLRRGAESAQARTRASGLAGLSTAEVSLRGVVLSQGSFVGILTGVDSKTYIVRAGDKLADGTIRTIAADAMVILQQVNDPLSLEKQREVRKMLRRTDEAK